MKIFKLILAFFFIAGVAIYIFVFSSFVAPWDRENAIQTTLGWGGLNRIPKSAENITIEKAGNMFTRQYKIRFDADKTEIDNWIKTSKRLDGNSPKIIGNKKLYDIHPGEQKSFGGKVEVEDESVLIDMSWS